MNRTRIACCVLVIARCGRQLPGGSNPCSRLKRNRRARSALSCLLSVTQAGALARTLITRRIPKLHKSESTANNKTRVENRPCLCPLTGFTRSPSWMGVRRTLFKHEPEHGTALRSRLHTKPRGGTGADDQVHGCGPRPWSHACQRIIAAWVHSKKRLLLARPRSLLNAPSTSFQIFGSALSEGAGCLVA